MFWGGRGRRKWVFRSGEHCMFPAFQKFLAGLQKSEELCDHGPSEWSVVVFELTFVALSLHPVAHQPVRTPSVFANLSFCSAYFDIYWFLWLKKDADKKHWRLGGYSSMKRRCSPRASVISRIAVADSHVPIVGLYLRSCWTTAKPKIMQSGFNH